MSADSEIDLGKGLPAGAKHYRAFVGEPERYDIRSATQFNLLTELGLREEHNVLDIGCGSLRLGRLLIPYLLPDRYCGVEPEEWLVQEAIARELGQSIVELKIPRFDYNRRCDFTLFGRQFDYVIAHSIFTHAPKGEIERCLENVSEVLDDQGVFLATIAEGYDYYTGDEWVYPACISHPFELFVDAGKRAGLICERFPWPDPTVNTWLIFHKSCYAGWNNVSKDHSGTFREYLRLSKESESAVHKLVKGIKRILEF